MKLIFTVCEHFFGYDESIHKSMLVSAEQYSYCIHAFKTNYNAQCRQNKVLKGTLDVVNVL